MDDEAFWLFGYGSLIWKPPPHFGRHRPANQRLACSKAALIPHLQSSGYLDGSRAMSDASGRRGELLHVARQDLVSDDDSGSEDHRGTPEAPGRVVTLIERSFWESLVDEHAATDEVVWGVAYRIEPHKVAEVKAELDLREINGYTIHYTPFHPADLTRPPIRTMVYIGTPDNAQFRGPQDPQELAEIIARSVGPSGENKEYLLMLEEELQSLCPQSGDGHVRDLGARVRRMEQERVEGHHPPDRRASRIEKAQGRHRQEELERA